MKVRHAAAHGCVIAEGAVAVDLAEVGKECFDEVHRIRALSVPGQLRFSPRLRNRCGCGMSVRCSACFVFGHKFLDASVLTFDCMASSGLINNPDSATPDQLFHAVDKQAISRD